MSNTFLTSSFVPVTANLKGTADPSMSTACITDPHLVTFTATETSGSATLTGASDTTQLQVGMSITGTGLPSPCHVLSWTVNTVTLSAKGTSNGSYTFSADSGCCGQAGSTGIIVKSITYEVRTLKIPNNFAKSFRFNSDSSACAGCQNAVTFTGTETNGSTTISSIGSTAGLQTGMSVTGTGILNTARITTVNANSIVLSQAGTSSGTYSFTAQGVIAKHIIVRKNDVRIPPQIKVYGPTVTFIGNTTNGSRVITSVSNFNGIYVGQTITGAGVPVTPIDGVHISVINQGAGTVSLDYKATATNTGTTFTGGCNTVVSENCTNCLPLGGPANTPTAIPLKWSLTLDNPGNILNNMDNSCVSQLSSGGPWILQLFPNDDPNSPCRWRSVTPVFTFCDHAFASYTPVWQMGIYSSSGVDLAFGTTRITFDTITFAQFNSLGSNQFVNGVWPGYYPFTGDVTTGSPDITNIVGTLPFDVTNYPNGPTAGLLGGSWEIYPASECSLAPNTEQNVYSSNISAGHTLKVGGATPVNSTITQTGVSFVYTGSSCRLSAPLTATVVPA
jgi:hypothetical protein